MSSHKFILDGKESPFEGYDGDLEGTKYSNATIFYTSNYKWVVQFIQIDEEDTDVVLDRYHIEFMNKVREVIQSTFESGADYVTINLDQILESIEGYLDVFDIWLTERSYSLGGKGFSNFYNLALLIDFSLIPVDNLSVVGDYSVFTYKGKTVAKFGTEIERFPSYVSHSVLTREIEKVTKKNPLAFKVVVVERLLDIGLVLQREFVN